VKSTREKVVRVCAQALMNLVEVRDGEYCQMMLDTPNELLATMTMLLERHWGDVDVLDTINELTDVLRKNYRILTSFERYQKEIGKGQLQFGPVHTEKFWRENVARFSANEFKMINILVAILDSAVRDLDESQVTAEDSNSGTPEKPAAPSLGAVAAAALGPPSRNPGAGSRGGGGAGGSGREGLLSSFELPVSDETVAVACYDLGEFVRFFPAGKNMAKTMGAKYMIMRLLEQHPSNVVKRNALESVSKMMVGNWQALSAE
jgi:V-type H+-transporting ATPase subunit H